MSLCFQNYLLFDWVGTYKSPKICEGDTNRSDHSSQLETLKKHECLATKSGSPMAQKIMVTLRLPRSMIVESAPVFRSRWNAMSRCKIWSKKCIATRRPVACPTGLNTVYRASLQMPLTPCDNTASFSVSYSLFTRHRPVQTLLPLYKIVTWK